MIIIRPFGGLANRIRVIASGLSLSERTNKRLFLIWDENEDLNCPFYSLFEKIDGIELLKEKKFHRLIKSSYHNSILKRIIAKFLNKLNNIDYSIFEKDFNEYWQGNINFDKIASRYKTLYFNTCEEFNIDCKQFLKFIPLKEIREKIEIVESNFNANTIGIHIRRTDHEKAKIYSPTEDFIKSMQNELDKDPKTLFFLATDDLFEEHIIKSAFGENRIITYKKELNRNTFLGIQDALVDLYCLSKTKKIYGSYWSSFTHIAAEFGKIENIIIRIFFLMLLY